MESFKQSKLLKTLLYIAVFIFFGYVVYQNINSYEVLAETIERANPVFLVYTLILGFGNLAIYSFILKKSFSIITKREEFPSLFNKTLVFQFLSISTPIGVTAGSAYIIKYLISQGVSHVRAYFGIMISNLAVNVSYFVVLAITIAYLYSINHLESYQLVAAYLILLINIGISFPLLMFTILPGISTNIAHFVVSIINFATRPILHRELLMRETVQLYIEEVSSISRRFDRSIIEFSKTLPIALTYHVINIITLFGAFYAFGTLPSILEILSLYGIIYLFTVISPTPYGIGIVEGLAHTSAVAMGMDSSLSLVGILIYRVSVLWLPSLIGLFTLRKPNHR